MLSGTLIRFVAFRYQFPDQPFTNYFQTLCRWDCGWYVRMAETGYDRFPVPSRINAGNWAFFPFYPMLVGLITKVIPLPTIVTASILSIITAYAAVVVAWPLLGRDRRAYALYGAFMLSGPVSIYFTTFFTEVMFVLLTTLVFRFLARSNYLGAAGWAAMLSATRIVGVFVSISIGIQALVDIAARPVPGVAWYRACSASQGWCWPFSSPRWDSSSTWRSCITGSVMAWPSAMCSAPGPPASPTRSSISGRASTTGPKTASAYPLSQVLALASTAGLVLTGVLAWRRQWAAAAFALLCILIPLAAGLASMLRFMSGMARSPSR